tara:strand:- start:47 stop:508 length:462 start_codon:yes stop_codon:yes gene_type:complete
MQQVKRIEEMTAREIVKYVAEITGTEITLSLKNKQGILRKAEQLLYDHIVEELPDAHYTAAEQAAVGMGLSIDQYLEFKANQEEEMIVDSVELSVLDLRGVSRWTLAQQHTQLTKVKHGVLSVMFGSRSALAKEVFSAVNLKSTLSNYDEFIC